MTLPSFLSAKAFEIRHRRNIEQMHADNVQISPRLFEPRVEHQKEFGALPIHFRLPNTWTLKIPVKFPFKYDLTVISVTNARSIFDRPQERAFSSTQQLLAIHSGQTLWAAHAVHTWQNERIRYNKTSDNRLEPWNRKPRVDTDSGNNSLSDNEFPMFAAHNRMDQ